MTRVRKQKLVYGLDTYERQLESKHMMMRQNRNSKISASWSGSLGMMALGSLSVPDVEVETPRSKAHIAMVKLLNEITPVLFKRYDIDGSGSINDKEELQQLSVNLAYSIKLKNFDLEKLKKLLDHVSNTLNWDMEDFKAWFACEIMLTMCQVPVKLDELKLKKKPISPCKRLYDQEPAGPRNGVQLRHHAVLSSFKF